MYILGLNIGHNATACLLKDGKIIGCISEERFSRIKNHYGFPAESIKFLLGQNSLDISKVDRIVLDNHYSLGGDPHFVKRFLKDYTEKSFKNRLLSLVGYNFPNLFKKYYAIKKCSLEKKGLSRSQSLKKNISEKLRFPENGILICDHHLEHALSSCSNISDDKKTLIFTLDGEGEGICATVSIFDGKNLNILSKSEKSASLGYLYALSTIYLGMKPLEHEFKVMGLAPYAKKDKVDELYNSKFKGLIWLEGLEFKSKFNMPFADCFFEKELKFLRFDNVAGAVQKLTEEITCEWIRKAIKKTGIHNIALSGGVFMNVKVNQKIAEMPEVKKIFVMPSCGDESNAIGACFYGYKRYCEENSIPFNPRPIRDLYLGPEYGNDYIENLIREKGLNKRYNITKVKNINKEVANLLARGEIVARCSGKSEWGARALGNRSILSSANNPDSIRILNETIKDRDFWMPFTPSIIDKYAKKYFTNPKNIFAPYMVITFDSTEQARKDIPAAMHPYDQTLRPQVVTKDYNPDYYRIIEEFSKLTGRGGILNTSFNLHGEPNVLTPEDALHTVENSDLRYLAMGDYLFEKI